MIVPHLHLLADYMLPSGVSENAPGVDLAWKLILFVTGFFFCVVVGAMTFFVIRYRRRTPNDVTSPVTHNTPLEIVWTGIPLILVIAFFYVGFQGFLKYDTPPSNAMNVDVMAQKWNFNFTYPNGAQDPNLYLLVGQPVRLNLTSIDVLHAIYLPNFRTQRNLVPGRQTFIWFVPTEEMPEAKPRTTAEGKVEMVPTDGYPIFCTQYCGDGHSRMFAKCFVLSKADYDAKMKELANPFKKKVNGKNVFLPYSTVGKTFYQQIGCAGCHSIDGSAGTGPTWQGLWKRPHLATPNGSDSDEAFHFQSPSSLGGQSFSLSPNDPDEKWEAYIKESILEPDAKLVKFGGKSLSGMSSFASALSGNTLNEEKRSAIIAFIKSIGTTKWEPATSPDKNSSLYDADNSPLKDDQGVPVHPESAQGVELLKKHPELLNAPPGN